MYYLVSISSFCDDVAGRQGGGRELMRDNEGGNEYNTEEKNWI
jgi:hypothetical protein